jgi:hypothetical protein
MTVPTTNHSANYQKDIHALALTMLRAIFLRPDVPASDRESFFSAMAADDAYLTLALGDFDTMARTVLVDEFAVLPTSNRGSDKNATQALAQALLHAAANYYGFPEAEHERFIARVAADEQEEPFRFCHFLAMAQAALAFVAAEAYKLH